MTVVQLKPNRWLRPGFIIPSEEKVYLALSFAAVLLINSAQWLSVYNSLTCGLVEEHLYDFL